jgi:hypothetical protein
MYNVTCQYPTAKRSVVVRNVAGQIEKDANGNAETAKIPETFTLTIAADSANHATKLARGITHGAICFIA